tara:strand:- start:1654 stop:3234 length:1581 start_codon:yes stop_codon:yes gene_type:complete
VIHIRTILCLLIAYGCFLSSLTFASTTRPASQPSLSRTSIPKLPTPKGHPLLQTWHKQYAQSKGKERVSTLIQIAKYGVKAPKKIHRYVSSIVTRALWDTAPEVRLRAAQQLFFLKARYTWTFRALSYHMNDPSAKVRAAIAETLGYRVKKPAPHIMKALYAHRLDPDERVRKEVFGALGRLLKTKIVKQPYILKNALEDTSLGVRREACLFVYSLGHKASVILPTLHKLVRKKRSPRIQLIHAIGAVSTSSYESVRLLGDIALKGSEKERIAAIEALGSLTKFDTQSLLYMSQALASSSVQLRLKALQGLAQIGKTSPAHVLPVLISTLYDRDASVRWTTLWAIGQLGHKAKMMIPFVDARTGDWINRVRIKAIYTLADIGGYKALCEQLQHRSKLNKRYAANAIEQLGTDARSIRSCVWGAWKDAKGSVKETLTRVLGSIGISSKAWLSPIEKMTMSKRWSEREAAIQVFTKLKQTTPTLKQKLMSLSQDKDERVRYAAKRALRVLYKSTPRPTSQKVRKGDKR